MTFTVPIRDLKGHLHGISKGTGSTEVPWPSVWSLEPLTSGGGHEHRGLHRGFTRVAVRGAFGQGGQAWCQQVRKHGPALPYASCVGSIPKFLFQDGPSHKRRGSEKA